MSSAEEDYSHYIGINIPAGTPCLIVRLVEHGIPSDKCLILDDKETSRDLLITVCRKIHRGSLLGETILNSFPSVDLSEMFTVDRIIVDELNPSSGVDSYMFFLVLTKETLEDLAIREGEF